MYRNSLYTIILFFFLHIIDAYIFLFFALYSISGLHDIINGFYYQIAQLFICNLIIQFDFIFKILLWCCFNVIESRKKILKLCQKKLKFLIGTNCKQWFVMLFYRKMTWSRQTSTQNWL